MVVEFCCCFNSVLDMFICSMSEASEKREEYYHYANTFQQMARNRMICDGDSFTGSTVMPLQYIVGHVDPRPWHWVMWTHRSWNWVIWTHRHGTGSGTHRQWN